jgi:putative SOS response-associated peptidase YedK
MCGRYSLNATPAKVKVTFDLPDEPTLFPRFNISPTQDVPVVRALDAGAGRRLDMLHWGLVPFWAKDPSIGSRMINARAESVHQKPAYKQAFARRRCLVVADGFYEWRKVPGQTKKQPYKFEMTDGEPFAFAGLWEKWQPRGSADDISSDTSGDTCGGDAIESCTIITTDANDLVAPVHDRMPVIIDPADYARWLDPAPADADALRSLLRPFPSDRMTSHPLTAPLVPDRRR